MTNRLSSDQKLIPHSNYNGNPPTKKLCYGEDGWVTSSFAIEIIVAHYNLRAAVQRAEYLEKNMFNRAQTKLKTVFNAKFHQEKKLIARNISILEKNLYECESKISLGSGLRKSYNLLRTNLAWYLRSELIDDCIELGGCCGRSCGCCKARQTSKWIKGAGHCTVEFTDEEKESIGDQLKRMLDRNHPYYLITMTMGYFSEVAPPKLQIAGTQALFVKEKSSEEEAVSEKGEIFEETLPKYETTLEEETPSEDESMS
ncbi:hypothetical protein N7486_002093 [Penicillium sp. IBT 16267x]|nr:hypothetical protein N7486_002093 [Penicillium sp. IBT 16267x]